MKTFFGNKLLGQAATKVTEIVVQLSGRDVARLRKIREEVTSLESDEEALLWALRRVVLPKKNVATDMGAPSGGGSGGGGKRGIGISIAGLIPDVPLDDTNLS